MSLDQAASLRAWALDKARSSQQEPTPSSVSAKGHRLVVAGLPGVGLQHANLVSERLQRWADRGYRWVGEPEQWQLVALGEDAVSSASLAREIKRWALWVETDIRAFDKAYQSLKLMQTVGAPSQVLALHEPDMPRKGLLDNLVSTAAVYCGINLLVLAS